MHFVNTERNAQVVLRLAALPPYPGWPERRPEALRHALSGVLPFSNDCVWRYQSPSCLVTATSMPVCRVFSVGSVWAVCLRGDNAPASRFHDGLSYVFLHGSV